MPTKDEFDTFFGSRVFNFSIAIDEFSGLQSIGRKAVYTNQIAEQELSMMYCSSYTFLSVPFENIHQQPLSKRQIHECIVSTHDILHTIGHDAHISWVLWNRLGNIWRSIGEAYFAVRTCTLLAILSSCECVLCSAAMLSQSDASRPSAAGRTSQHCYCFVPHRRFSAFKNVAFLGCALWRQLSTIVLFHAGRV